MEFIMHLVDFLFRNVEWIIGLFVTAGTGGLLKLCVERFIEKKDVDKWIDGVNETFGTWVIKVMVPTFAGAGENLGIFFTKLMSGKIGKAIWNNTFEPILIWVIEGLGGILVNLATGLVSGIGSFITSIVKGLRSDNQKYKPVTNGGLKTAVKASWNKKK